MKELAAKYLKLLTESGWTPFDCTSVTDAQLHYVAWICKCLPNLLDGNEEDKQKASVLFGFACGILWAEGFLDDEELAKFKVTNEPRINR